MKAVVFDVFGDYGHFKKYYTTSSPLTFSFPPPPTLQGIVGAFLGIEKERNHSILQDYGMQVAVSIRFPIRHIRLTINHINTKGGRWTITNGRIQIRTEFLCSPRYRLYVTFRDEERVNEFSALLKAHKTIFTISLGLSELLANYQWVGCTNVEPVQDTEGLVDSVFPIEFLHEKNLQLEPGKAYRKEHVATYV